MMLDQLGISLTQRRSVCLRHVLDDLIQRNAEIVCKEQEKHDAGSVSIGRLIIFRVDVGKIRVAISPPLLGHSGIEPGYQTNFWRKFKRHDPADRFSVGPSGIRFMGQRLEALNDLGRKEGSGEVLTPAAGSCQRTY